MFVIPAEIERPKDPLNEKPVQTSSIRSSSGWLTARVRGQPAPLPPASTPATPRCAPDAGTRYDSGFVAASLRRLGPVLLVALLAANVVAVALPCPDDLLVELGAGPEQCVADAPHDAGSPTAPPAPCPCACHMGLDVGAGVRVEPTSLATAVLPLDAASTPEDLLVLIQHPPRA